MTRASGVVVVLNGPLGVGKSTLAEALCESVDRCAMLDGDHLVSVNPPSDDGLGHLHGAVEVLVGHHRRFGYRHFVINHLWTSPAELDDLRRTLSRALPEARIHVVRLTLPMEDNLARIRGRARARALDERAFEERTVREERDLLQAAEGDELGEPFDVSDPPAVLVERLLARLAVPKSRDP